MSSLIAAIDADQVVVGSDTLCTPLVSGHGKTYFGSKVLYMPHMRMLLCGSGPCGFVEDWWMYLNRHKVFPGIESLSRVAQTELKAFWQRWKAANPYPEGSEQEMLILHFGVSELTGEILGIGYVSWDDFAPTDYSFRTRKEPSIFHKPLCRFVPPVESMEQMPAAMYQMMLEQRENQATKFYDPEGDGEVRVGGELQIYRMNKVGCSIYTAARFPDYEAVAHALWGDFRGTSRN